MSQNVEIKRIFSDTLFDWVEIPKGNVTLVSDKIGIPENYLKQNITIEVPAFVIAKYPVTNAQFGKFIDAKGYEQQRWWTEAGWQQKEKDKWTEPRFWNKTAWNGALQPVVGVSWYEALAFCLWLKETTGANIMLPTEQQWQRAAQALPDGRDSGYMYPWGNEWNCERCNNSVQPCDSNGTTVVSAYVGKGDSPCGVVDMSGNVWEWCKTAYYTGGDDVNGIDTRVLRGGSWETVYIDDFCTTIRLGFAPDVRHYRWGFRFVRPST